MKSLFIFLLSLIYISIFSQSLPASRSTDWTIAGLRDTTYPSALVVFTGDNTGVTDNSSSLITLLAGLTQPTIIQFEAGNYLFNSEIILPSNVVIRGKGAGITTFTFSLGGIADDCFRVIGTEPATEYALTADALKDDFVINPVSTAAFNVGDYVRFIKDDANLVNDAWAERRTGQISRISAKTATSLTLESTLRMNFLTSENSRVRKVNPKSNVGLECFSLVRIDPLASTANPNQSSNIRFNRTVNSWVKGVESIKCNYAHFEAQYCANLLVSECYFHDAFDFGDGGRAYGVMLHYATSESRIENTIFKTLRHAMILQGGANGNVFAYNYSTDTKKGSFKGEDMVCHGNYPYLNLFEGNVAEWASVDNSHGENGPYNTFFRNRATISGFNVTSYNIFGFVLNNSNQDFLGNEGTQSISGSGHQQTLNSWQATSGSLETSLAYGSKPDFLTQAQFGAIGYGYFNTNASNPAKDRHDAANYIAGNCGYHLWDGTQWANSFVPDANSTFFDLHIKNGNTCALTTSTNADAIIVEPAGKLEITSPATLNISDSIYLKADATSYSQFNGDVSLPMVFEMLLQNEGWHLLASPLLNIDLTAFEKELNIRYSGDPNLSSAFSWNPTTAKYEAISNNAFNFGASGMNLYTADFLVKTGKGINNDGNLPVKIQLKGMSRNGSITNSSLGYGIATDYLGPDADGWNLMMNPYPCAIDLDLVFDALPANYQAGAHVYKTATNSYEVRTLSAINNGNASSIAPGQAFYVKLDNGANLNSGFYDFDNSVRTADDSPLFYKNTYPGLTLKIESDNTIVSSARIFLSEAGRTNYTSSIDISAFKQDFTEGWLAGWVKPSENGFKLLNVAGFHYDSIANIIPITIIAPASKTIKIAFEKDDLDNQFYLKDTETGEVFDIENQITVSVKKGKNANRFFLVTKPSYLYAVDLIAEVHLNATELSISYSTEMDGFSALILLDVSGRTLLEVPSFSAKAKQTWQLPRLSPGIYILSILEGGTWKTIKLVI